jgi:hypothetical protein
MLGSEDYMIDQSSGEDEPIVIEDSDVDLIQRVNERV